MADSSLGQFPPQTPSNHRTLFILGANVSIHSSTFDMIIQYIGECNFMAHEFFEHVRFFELFRDQLEDYNPEKDSAGIADGYAHALMILWEIDRVMPQNLWDRLIEYVNRYSKSTPIPVILFANLSAEVLLSSTDYVERLVKDVQWFLTQSFDQTPSKYLWKCLLLRDNQLQPAYFKAHLQWLFSKTRRKPVYIVPADWKSKRRNSVKLIKMSSEELLTCPKISQFSPQAGAEKTRFFNSDNSETAQWFRQMAEKALEATKEDTHRAQRKSLMPQALETEAKIFEEVSAAIINAESTMGRQEWMPGELSDGLVKHLVCHPKTSDGKAYKYVIDLPTPMSKVEVNLLLSELAQHHHTMNVTADNMSGTLVLHNPNSVVTQHFHYHVV